MNANVKNNDGNTPLHIAVFGDSFEIVKYLIEKGADVNAKNKEGKTPLDLAKSKEIKKLLRQAGRK